MRDYLLCLAIILFAGCSAEDDARNVLDLHMMSDAGLKGMGAVCLDGSDAGFYFSPAMDPNHTDDWHLFFEGGGWCYDKADCWTRAFTPLGSSKPWAHQLQFGGTLSGDCDFNPDFCKFNRAVLPYCDGASFTGDLDEPLKVLGLDGHEKLLYFRGKRVLTAVLQALLPLGLHKAKRLILSGCSAGGLSAFLHADFVYEWLKSVEVPLTRFKVLPLSGFFLLHAALDGRPVYEYQMREVFLMANSSGGVNRRCIAAMSEYDAWRCMFAQFSYDFIRVPIFPIGSAYDSWQDQCIYASSIPRGFPDWQQDTKNGYCGTAPGWKACLDNTEDCNETQAVAINKYLISWNLTLSRSQTFHRPGNGAFSHSCHTHCEACSKEWGTIAVGGVTMREAVGLWWNSEADQASRHTYSPCLYHTTGNHQCNPTCAAKAAGDKKVITM